MPQTLEARVTKKTKKSIRIEISKETLKPFAMPLASIVRSFWTHSMLLNGTIAQKG